jgi:UDP-N-acetyl-D-galactosamine dehydrogenase
MREYHNKKDTIAVIGLGYVGLPLALNFAHHYKVIGYDINTEHVNSLQHNIDPHHELSDEDFFGCDIKFTYSTEDIRQSTFYIIAVPTPIDEYKKPDLKSLIDATRVVASVLKKNDIIVYESTVYPGCTEEECVPIVEKISGLKYITDFKVGYSPERINPGDKEHTFIKIKKVVSGCDAETLDCIAEVYGKVVEAGVFKAASIKVAEAAKIIENTQRDVNIGLMNELSIIFHSMGINTSDILDAARTKWNFLSFTPGLVGGHCIGVDPYYLAYKAARLGYHPQLINAGRFINDSMAAYVAKNVIIKLVNSEKDIKLAKILVLGITFKENITDIRNSKVVDLIRELNSFGIKDISIYDPHANPEEVEKVYHLQLIEEIEKNSYDVIVLAVPHNEFLNFNENEIKSFLKPPFILFDLKSSYYSLKDKFSYWNL